MKKFIVTFVSIMALIIIGCSTLKTAPLTQTPAPLANETALNRFERGSAYLKAGLYEDAVKDFSEAIASDPNFADAYYSRGQVFGRLGKHDEAIGDFTKAILLNPENVSAYADRGTAYGSLGKLELAISDFSKAIALDPNFANAYYNRAVGYFSQKKCTEARKDLYMAQYLDYQRIRPEFLDALNKNCPEN